MKSKYLHDTPIFLYAIYVFTIITPFLYNAIFKQLCGMGIGTKYSIPARKHVFLFHYKYK